MPYKNKADKNRNARERYANDPETKRKNLERTTKYYEEHKEHLIEKNKEWAKNNPDKVKAKRDKYRNANRDELNSNNNDRRRELRKTDTEYAEKNRQYQRDYYKQIKKEIFNAYGNECAKCGETIKQFLEIGHINNDGKENRMDVCGRNTPDLRFYLWVRKEGFPKTLELECHSCNCVKGEYTDNENGEYNKKLKQEVINAYGGRCACCGMAEMNKLTLDHRDGGGNKHRKSLSPSGISNGTALYQYLRKNGYPDTDKYQVLCWNCNMGRQLNGGICPHKSTVPTQE